MKWHKLYCKKLICMCKCLSLWATYFMNNGFGHVLSSFHPSFSPVNGNRFSFQDNKFCSEYQMMDKIQMSCNLKYLSSSIYVREGKGFYSCMKSSFYVTYILHWIKWKINQIYVTFIGVNITILLIFFLCKYFIKFVYVNLLIPNVLCYYRGLVMVELQDYCLYNIVFFVLLNNVILKVMD